MKKNILLVIIDALRYDAVEKHMPWLYKWGQSHVSFTNHRSVSHCTDPSITSMLTGLHPDSLRLYSMMFNRPAYTIPEDVVLLSQTALEEGFDTAMISNLSRWYRRAQNHYVDCRGWHGQRIFNEGIRLINNLEEPWFLIIHDDSCHTNYLGGSYDTACGMVDGYIKALLETTSDEETWVIVTSDHGEGLGEKTVSGRVVEQHGFGLDAFLTHVPLLTNTLVPPIIDALTDSGVIHTILDNLVWFGERAVRFKEIFGEAYVFQAGATPKVFHRGVVLPDGRQFITETTREGRECFWIGEFTDEEKYETEGALRDHCAQHGIIYGDLSDEAAIVERLKGLGYFE